MKRLQHGALALVCYLPLLLTDRGWVAADTKAYLYLDPSRLVGRAAWLWDEHTALGTVTHQNIGYLWPMGPWFWFFETVGAPDWFAQRLWMGTLLFAAGAGVLYLGRTIGPQHGWAWATGAVAYLMTPYVLDYVSRISVLLLPWAALPWLIGLVHRAAVTGSWRHPAAFALVVLTAGGINATALVLAGLGPVLWLVFMTFVHREIDWRRALGTVGRVGVLTVFCNLWWMAGLAVQNGWGLDVLRYTETVETVARTSLSSEVLRGLGYWFFYGTDKLGPWIEPGATFTESPWLIGIGFVLPIAAVVAAVLVRWRYRAFAVALVLLGTAAAVGAFPYRSPSPIGALFKRFATSSTAGLALRSTARAVPLVVLGLSLLLVAGIAALGRRRPRAGVGVAVAVMAVAAAANPSLWDQGFVADNLRRPEELPAYWQEATTWLDQQGDETRVLEIPGSDFATYRWGNSVDPITPGLMDRPYVARELIPFGTEPSADLLIALDRRIQEGVLDPAALVPVARLMAAGDIVVRGDLEYERYRTARPAQVWDLLTPRPRGLERAVPFGEPAENRAAARLPMRDEVFLATRDTAVHPPVAAFPVDDPLPIVRTRSARRPIVLAGDGEGVVDAAAAGLLGGDSVILSAAALDGPVGPDATVIVTDTNRRRARRWGTVRDNDGYTEQAGEEPLGRDPSDNRLPLFPDAGEEWFTTVEQRGVARVQATAYGNPVSYTPADRPVHAFDGDPSTAWAVGALGRTLGERLLLETDEPVTTNHIDIVQAGLGPRAITELAVELDGERVGVAELGPESFRPEGQRIDLGGRRTFSTLELVIEADSVGVRANYADQPPVGIAEVDVAGVRVDEVVRVPEAPVANGNPLAFVFSRLRANPQEPFARDEERTMKRAFEVPSGRTFQLAGMVRIDPNADEKALDQLLGGRAAKSSGRLAGVTASRASSAFDGDAETAWTNQFGDQAGAWIEADAGAAVTLDELELRVVDDGDHSVPTRVGLSVDGGEPFFLDVPTGDAVSIALPEPLTGRVFRLLIDDYRPVESNDWFSGRPVTMPVAIAEVGIPAAERVEATTACRRDLVRIDGRAVSVRVHGERLALCDRDAGGLRLGAGDHELRTSAGSALDIDQLVLSAGVRPAAGGLPRAGGGEVEVRSKGSASFELTVTGDEPVWLVLGQSRSPGWQALAEGDDLGDPSLVDGYANGWLVDPGDDGSIDVTLTWTPQRYVWAGLGVSALGVLLCLGLVLIGLRRRVVMGAVAAPDPSLRQRPWLPGPVVPWVKALLLSAGAGVVAALVVHPAAVLVGPATLLALRLPWGRLIGVGAVGGVALAGAFTVGKQARNDFVADFGWTDFFRPAHYLAWTGLVLLAVVLLVDWARRRRD